METTNYIYMPFVGKGNAQKRLIEGPVSANMVDLDGQLVDPTWLRGALPKWMQYGNIREQHNQMRPVGKAVALDLDHPVGPHITAKIADDECWRKIEDGVFSGFSIGVKNARVVQDGRAPKGTIVGGEVMEISVVDHPSARKAAFTLVTKAAGGWVDVQSGEAIVEDLTKSGGDDPKHDAKEGKESETQSPDHKEDGTGDYDCDLCGEDVRYCDCYSEKENNKDMHKAAADFEQENAKPRAINPGHPDVKGKDVEMHAYGAMHEGPESNGAMYTGHDAKVRLDYSISKAEHLVNRIQDALDALNSANFNPNAKVQDGTERVKSGDAKEMGRLAPEKQEWHGSLVTDADADRKAATLSADDVKKIASDSAALAIENFFLDNGGILNKSAAPDSAKAMFLETVKAVSSAIAYEAFDQLEARLTQVEKMPMPSKGIASAADKNFQNLNSVERSMVEQDITKMVSTMGEDQKLSLVAQAISYDWSQANKR